MRTVYPEGQLAQVADHRPRGHIQIRSVEPLPGGLVGRFDRFAACNDLTSVRAPGHVPQLEVPAAERPRVLFGRNFPKLDRVII